MADADNRRPEEPICRDANEQEDRDHDWRHEIFHVFPCSGAQIQRRRWPSLLRSRRTSGEGTTWSALDHNMANSAAAPRPRQASNITV